MPLPTISTAPVQPQAAIDFWASKAAMPYDEIKNLCQGARQRAFYITGLLEHDAVQSIKDALQEALEKGETLTDFKVRCQDIINKQGWHSHRITTIFHNNMQTAYMAGRYSKMQAVKKTRPYWQYYTTGDERVRPHHAVLNNQVWLADHEFWDAHYPPNGHRCHCGVRTLSKRQIEKKGLSVQTDLPGPSLYTDPKTGMEYHVARPGADNGWHGNAGKSWLDGLDLKKYPDLNGQSYSKLRPKQIEQIIDPITLRPSPVKNYDELGTAIQDKCGQFVKNSQGINQVVFDRKNYLMATNCKGRFFISTKGALTNNGAFSAAVELKNAWNKLAQGQDLSWFEEYSIESLWHEILHNRQIVTPLKKGSQLNIMEAMTQWTARRTYPELLKSLGAKALHQDSIKAKGLGYGTYVRNLDKLFQALNIKETELLPHMLKIIEKTKTDKYGSSLQDILSHMSGQPAKKISTAINKIKLGNYDFEQALKDMELML